MKKEKRQLLLIIFGIGFIFLPSLFGYFSGDDWAVMRTSQISSLPEFFNFFLAHTPQSLTFFRPLPQQLFFNLFGALFGLHPFPYYFFVLSCFLLSLYFLYRLARKIGFDHLQALLTVTVYGTAAANFARIYFLSAFQDVLLPLLVILSLLTFLDKRYWLFLLYFALALLSKETAVVTPFLLIALTLYLRKKNYTNTIPYLLVVGLYLFYRLKYFGGAVGDSYLWDFSLKKAANTLLWYGLWTLGTPEIMVDYVGSGLRIIPRYYTDFPQWGKVILAELGSLFTIFFAFLIVSYRDLFKKHRLVFFCLFIFVVSLAPVLFMPWHKFTHALSLPMIGSSLLLGFFLSKPSFLSKALIAVYLVTNISMMFFLYPRFYAVNRGKISRLVYTYFAEIYPSPPLNTSFLFVNDPKGYKGGENQSKEVALAVSQSDFFKVFYHDRSYQVYFVDLPISTPSGTVIHVDSGQFLKRY